MGRGYDSASAGRLRPSCLLSFAFECVSDSSLIVLSVPSLSCLSICLSLEREGKEGPMP